MVLQYHHKYMLRLANVYLQNYSKYGYESASTWFNNFLDAEHRKRIGPFIRSVAEEQNLEID